VKFNNTSEATVYDIIWKRIGHEKSTITLLKDFANLEIRACESRLPNVTDAKKKVALQNVITAFDGYKSSLDRLVQRLDLRTNFIKNVQNY
jgi:hypothetical protein